MGKTRREVLGMMGGLAAMLIAPCFLGCGKREEARGDGDKKAVAVERRGDGRIDCLECGQCICGRGIDIPAHFSFYNRMVEARMLDAGDAGVREKFLASYARAVGAGEDALQCTGCGKCLKYCPQKIDIMSEMQRIGKIVAGMRGVAG